LPPSADVMAQARAIGQAREQALWAEGKRAAHFDVASGHCGQRRTTAGAAHRGTHTQKQTAPKATQQWAHCRLRAHRRGSAGRAVRLPNGPRNEQRVGRRTCKGARKQRGRHSSCSAPFTGGSLYQLRPKLLGHLGVHLAGATTGTKERCAVEARRDGRQPSTEPAGTGGARRDGHHGERATRAAHTRAGGVHPLQHWREHAHECPPPYPLPPAPCPLPSLPSTAASCPALTRCFRKYWLAALRSQPGRQPHGPPRWRRRPAHCPARCRLPHATAGECGGGEGGEARRSKGGHTSARSGATLSWRWVFTAANPSEAPRRANRRRKQGAPRKNTKHLGGTRAWGSRGGGEGVADLTGQVGRRRPPPRSSCTG
jgi:hypothetical protein